MIRKLILNCSETGPLGDLLIDNIFGTFQVRIPPCFHEIPDASRKETKNVLYRACYKHGVILFHTYVHMHEKRVQTDYRGGPFFELCLLIRVWGQFVLKRGRNSLT